MTFIIPSNTDLIRLQLSRDKTRIIKQGYPWIYNEWLKDRPKTKPGKRAMVKDKDGTPLAFGMYDPNSPLSVRICAVEQEQLNDQLIEARLETALKLRKLLFNNETTGFRLINGEGDGIPGLVCDIYGDTAVIKLDGAGPSNFWNVPEFAKWLQKKLDLRLVYQKIRSGDSGTDAALYGQLEGPTAKFCENGLLFQANIVDGQKTGFFFDQRDNRARIRTLSPGRKVLNLFGYTGGFSIYAGAGGAAHVTTVDLAKPAIAEANENWRLNQLEDNKHSGVAADAFEFLEQSHKDKRYWDLVVVDPPSFAPAERLVEKAKESYQKLFVAALKVTNSGGIIALSSCSSHISMTLFNEICQAALSKARRRATMLGVYGQPEDHPFPSPCTELQYLKFVTLMLR